MTDASVLPTELTSFDVDVERGRLRFFAKATGSEDPIYVDVDAARAAGHRDLPVPLSFLLCLEMEQPDPFEFLTDLGIDVRNVLHGEQEFHYESLAYAGDRLTFHPRITDRYTKKAGELEFIVKETEVTTGSGGPIARLRTVLIAREPAGAQT
jgi:N-terminal half of MaoC dehydratase